MVRMEFNTKYAYVIRRDNDVIFVEWWNYRREVDQYNKSHKPLNIKILHLKSTN